MRKIKLVIFKVHGKSVEEIEGSEITLDQVDIMKTNIAIMHGVSYDDVDVEAPDIEIPDTSPTASINNEGKLMFRPDNPYASWRLMSGLSPAFDITQDKLFDEFLSLLLRRDIDNAIVFR